MARSPKHQHPKRNALPWVIAVSAGALVAGGLISGFIFTHKKSSAEQPFAAFGGSQSCRDCHAQEFDAWKGSHHALAERTIVPSVDSRFFQGETVKHGTQSTIFKKVNGAFQICPESTNCMRLTRVIGVDPLQQFLAPTTNGRLQVTELAADPKKGDWFDVFGNEDRKPGEWGHWTGRGMNWNNMCAVCHNTALQKRYDIKTDSYATIMEELGVSCESCHGAMGSHVAWQRQHPDSKTKERYVPSVKGDAMVDTCGSCHARRGELTDEFKPGEQFLDHFQPTIPDETDIYYADGQVRDEDYEYVSFLGSRMHSGGVVCMDCHEPHSGKRRLPGNDLCMRCHGGNAESSKHQAASSREAPNSKLLNLDARADVSVRAPIIDPMAHSHHPMGKGGSLCTDCHMPTTVYMQRHTRHDHGFTIPDPLLTVEAGIPNACNKCHTDKTAQWAVEANEKWYGTNLTRFTRTRAQAMIASRRGDTNAVDLLLSTIARETNALWRASEITSLGRWITEPRVAKKIFENATAHDPLPRAMAARALGRLAARQDSEGVRVLQILARDNVRAVRIEAAQSLRSLLDTNSPAGHEYFAFLEQNADQPTGAMQLGGYYFDHGDAATALTWFRKAVDWDTNSAPLRHELAVALSANGRIAEAIEQLRAACHLAPNDGEYHCKLGLALAETGDLNGATSELEQATAKNPDFSDGWYNLGLAYSQSGRLEDAVRSIERAEKINGAEARYPYARATILARMNRTAEAKEAALHVLSIDPKNQQAVELLQSMENNL
jgi:Flp pilus assembly protein TadD